MEKSINKMSLWGEVVETNTLWFILTLSMHIKLCLHHGQAFFIRELVVLHLLCLMTHYWEIQIEKDREAKIPSGYESMTYRSEGMRSTAELQPLSSFSLVNYYQCD